MVRWVLCAIGVRQHLDGPSMLWRNRNFDDLLALYLRHLVGMSRDVHFSLARILRRPSSRQMRSTKEVVCLVRSNCEVVDVFWV